MREISRIWQLLALVFVCMFVLSGLAGAVLNNSEGLNSIEAERSTDLKELESASKTDSITETQEDITSDDRSPHDPQKDREDRAREEKEPRPDREKRDRTDRPERPERDERPERRVKDKRDYVERQRPVRPEQEAYVNSYDETDTIISHPNGWNRLFQIKKYTLTYPIFLVHRICRQLWAWRSMAPSPPKPGPKL